MNKFLLSEYEFMSEMYLRQPGFTDSACGGFAKNIFIKMEQIKHLFNMIQLMVILEIQPEKQ